jgi:hypothetical protein
MLFLCICVNFLPIACMQRLSLVHILSDPFTYTVDRSDICAGKYRGKNLKELRDMCQREEQDKVGCKHEDQNQVNSKREDQNQVNSKREDQNQVNSKREEQSKVHDFGWTQIEFPVALYLCQELRVQGVVAWTVISDSLGSLMYQRKGPVFENICGNLHFEGVPYMPLEYNPLLLMHRIETDFTLSHVIQEGSSIVSVLSPCLSIVFVLSPYLSIVFVLSPCLSIVSVLSLCLPDYQLYM